MRPLSIVLGVLFATAALSPGNLASAAVSGLEITSVGHEGFLLRSGGQTVLLDSFLGPSETERDTLVRNAVGRLLSARAPFERIGVALISHPHRDHFDAQATGSFLEKHRETVCVVTPDVLADMKSGCVRFAAIQSRLVEVKWGTGRRVSKDLNGVRVDFVRTAHEASQFYPDDVALHVVHINGMNVLHGADAEMLTDQLNTLHLENESLDVAILPYSFLASPGAAKRFAEHLGAKRVVAMHLPVAEIEKAKVVVLAQFPDATFLVNPMDSVRF